MRQLTLALPHGTLMERSAFLISACNAQAANLVDGWRERMDAVHCFHGPSGCGKSHLAVVLAHRIGGPSAFFDADALSDDPEPERPLMDGGSSVSLLVIDHLHRLCGGPSERILFHLMNMARHANVPMLLLSETAPARLSIALPDLASRIRTATVVRMGEPDDDLLRGVLEKLFKDRQMKVDSKISAYVSVRIERRFEALEAFVDSLSEWLASRRAALTLSAAIRFMAERAAADVRIRSDGRQG